MPAATPPLIPQPFAQGGSKNTIPNTTADIQRASFALGFPPATMQPIDAGGVPMLGPDMNGALFDAFAWLFALQGGQLKPYDAAVSSAIAGYALGAVVLMADGAGYWQSTTNGNVTDPDAGGDGWQPLYVYGGADISGLAGGSRTLSVIEASRYFLVMTGALVANQQIVVPNAFRNWLIVNATTGAFTLTVKTTAGAGVAVPQGGAASPTAVWCDTVNVNPVFVPSALPTSVAPTNNSIVLRDNTARQFGLTADVGTRTTQVATTEFVIPTAPTLAANGVRYNPDGTIEQWGFKSRVGTAPETVTFPVAFPTVCYGVQLTLLRAGSNSGQAPTLNAAPGIANFAVNQADSSTGVYWHAFGR